MCRIRVVLTGGLGGVVVEHQYIMIAMTQMMERRDPTTESNEMMDRSIKASIAKPGWHGFPVECGHHWIEIMVDKPATGDNNRRIVLNCRPLLTKIIARSSLEPETELIRNWTTGLIMSDSKLRSTH